MAGGNIKVVVRVRPFNGRELDRKAKCVVQMKDAQTILIPPPDAEERLRGSKGGKVEGQKVFAFDKSYWSFNRADPHFAGQDSLFNDLGSPLLDNAFKGYNNCIFAYGQTGSGKSYSMMGYGEESGVIPRICQNMFERITDLQKDKNLSYTVEVSYLEIYNERVRDLLNPSTKGNLKVREHPSTGPYVEDLAKLVVRSFPEIQHLMDEGNKARTVAATSMNETSSRSHAVFTLTVTQKRHDVETAMDTEKVAKISLVDLAGSERATSTGATGARLKEGAEINRSLSTLGRVIAALADLSTGKKKNMSMVPYRDSVLTWLLKDSLGGNSMTAMIAAISPADINFEETLSTLRYADSAKRIKNHAVVNEDPNARMIRELKEELAQLRSKLSSGATSGGIAEEQYAPDTPLDQQIVSIVQADGSIKKVSKAEIAEQLNQSEKLYDDLNQTWEDKLQKTEQIHKEREAALEELGISIEKGFVGLSTPKKMPHLVNLSDDPLLAECLVYNIKPGTTTVGNVDDPSTTSEIRLNGSKVHPNHCAFENVDGLVTLVPQDGAAIMVNGLRIEKPKRLRSGDRVILGDFHIFRFNHPQEARDERKEQSLLRHAITTSQLGSPMPRPGHSRSISRAESDTEGETSRSASPLPHRKGRDSDWSYARREAASAILGADQKIAHLTDDELDSLFDDVQRVRAVRKGRPESRLFGPDDEDFESISSYPHRDKYLSNGTIDNVSLDTALTIPSSPPQDGTDGLDNGDEKSDALRDDAEERLNNTKDGSPENSGTVDGDAQDSECDNQTLEMALKAAKEDFERQIQQQKEAFDEQLKQISRSPLPRVSHEGFTDLPTHEKGIALRWISSWRQARSVRMAEVILQHAALLKEVQVMSQAMDKNVTFQFTIVAQGQSSCSSYDLVLSGVAGDEDESIETATKPCVAVRLVDYQHRVIHLWSIEKLEARLQDMRRIHQYLGKQELIQHFQLENPFIESCMPQFSLIGETSVPLTAVFEAHVQDYTLNVVSTFTQSTIGVIRLSLEPSSAHAPSTMLKFNVVMHDLVGFPEHEGTNVHAQLSIPGISEEGGATTTQMISDFDEDRIQFESVHSMSLPHGSPRTASLRVSLYARVTSMHMDKLISWDEIRESSEAELMRSQQRATPRVPESEYYVQEQHDVFAKIKILELLESGHYVPVEAEQNSNVDVGTYQLRQGLQRRVKVNLSYSSRESLQWTEVASLRVGNIRLMDPGASVSHASSPNPDVPLRFIGEPQLTENGNGIKELTVMGQWDSSLHGSTLLDRPTSEGYTVQIAITVDVKSSRVTAPMTFCLDQNVQIRPRSWLRPQSLFKQLWKTTRLVHTTSGIFSVTLKPASAKRAADIWRMDSKDDYFKGEELLSNWKPRGVSLIRDYIKAQKRKQYVADVDAAKVLLGRLDTPRPSNPVSSTLTEKQQQILNHCISLWTAPSPDHTLAALHPSPPTTTLPTKSTPSPPRLIPTITSIPKNPIVTVSSYLLSPTPRSQTRWARHFAELRLPYLHIYNVPSGEQAYIINLRHARIDIDPPLQHLLCGDGGGGGGYAGREGAAGWGKNVWAVYGAMNTWLFAARSEREKGEWVLAVDEGFLGE